MCHSTGERQPYNARILGPPRQKKKKSCLSPEQDVQTRERPPPEVCTGWTILAA